MKARNTLVSGFLFLSALYAPLAVAQANPWTQTQVAPNVYVAGADNSNFFSVSSSVSSSKTITKVSWNIGLYSNGATNQNIKLCYKPLIGSETCRTNLAASLSGSTSMFNGLSVRGTFRITYNLMGGTYPAYPSFSNTLTVGWR
ncbi:MAG: flagellar protein FlhE [Azoarcus sp.]|jgi:hypothetical protein|nr:flagellar protein FlhE [Azoarcus sp.]